jgi:hypothetical protein
LELESAGVLAWLEESEEKRELDAVGENNEVEGLKEVDLTDVTDEVTIPELREPEVEIDVDEIWDPREDSETPDDRELSDELCPGEREFELDD